MQATKEFLAGAGAQAVLFPYEERRNDKWRIEDIEEACEGAEFGPSFEIQFDSNGGDVQKTPQRQVDAWVEEVCAYANGRLTFSVA